VSNVIKLMRISAGVRSLNKQRETCVFIAFMARPPCNSIVKSGHVVLNIAQELQCGEVVMIGGYNKKSELMLMRRDTASV